MNSLTNSRNNLTTTFSTGLNQLALLAICGSLIAAFYYQIAFNELPCPLCQLQRVALTLAGIGMMLNIRFGPSNVHYAMILASALVGAATSLRQVLLHIAPGDSGYGSALFGLHFYTWGFISFVMTIAFCALMLCIDRQPAKPSRRNASGKIASAVIILFLTLG
ncbi:MAG: disulfide bond formation protein B, partial [Alcaligenaceae bacterium]